MNFLYPRFPYVWLYVTERILSENIRIFTACTAEMILRFYLKDFFLFAFSEKFQPFSNQF